jgi:hypothetical protein
MKYAMMSKGKNIPRPATTNQNITGSRLVASLK